ncbi:MAG: sensor histidine kinase, partial [Opitutaceae bacterium]
ACIRLESEQTMDLTLRLTDGLLLTVQLTSRLASPDGENQQHVHTAITNISKLNQVSAVVQDIEREREAYTHAVCHPGGPAPATVSRHARTLLHDHATELSTQVKNTLERMECAAVRMEATFQDLLDFCCLGHDSVALDPVNLEELMQHVVMEQRIAIQRRRAEIAVERPLPCVRGAHMLLGQVLVGVVTNMLHCGAGQPPRLRISAAQQDGEIVLTIVDECMLADAPLDERSFRAFERRHERDSYWCNDIGLAVIRRTIERMNGRVWVDSGLGKNTSFNIGLPAV